MRWVRRSGNKVSSKYLQDSVLNFIRVIRNSTSKTELDTWLQNFEAFCKQHNLQNVVDHFWRDYMRKGKTFHIEKLVLFDKVS